MLLRVLAVGDVAGRCGLDCLSRYLRTWKKNQGVHFVVVNGENADGMGLLPSQAEEIFAAGADVITLGNHTWSRRQICDYLEDCPWILRPANFAPHLPGRGFGVFDGPAGLRIGVLNLMGRYELDCNLSSPFRLADEVLRKKGKDYDILLVDFHAEATSEKGAMGWYLDSRAEAVWGTHTHIPTADAQVLPGGTGFVTDLGMTGPINSILGVRPEVSIGRFLGDMPHRYEAASGPARFCSVLFTIDTDTGRCVEAVRCDTIETAKRKGGR